MDRGVEFIKDQVANAVMQHGAFLRSLEDHGAQSDDQRFRDLCTKYIPVMREHQRMLESFQGRLGTDEGAMKKVIGKAMGVARDLADSARQSDFLRLVGDIVMARQSEATFKTFRDAGRTLGITELAKIGEMGERHHDDYAADAGRLVQQMFVEHARGAEVALGESARTGSRPGSTF